MRRKTAFRILRHDRSTTAGAVLGVVAIVFLVGQQLSVLFGLLNYMSVLVDHSGADAWVMSGSVRNADAGNLTSGRYLDRIIGLPEVEWAEPVLIGNGLFRTPDNSFEPVRVVGVRRPRLSGGPWAYAEADERALLDVEAVVRAVAACRLPVEEALLEPQQVAVDRRAQAHDAALRTPRQRQHVAAARVGIDGRVARPHRGSDDDGSGGQVGDRSSQGARQGSAGRRNAGRIVGRGAGVAGTARVRTVRTVARDGQQGQRHQCGGPEPVRTARRPRQSGPSGSRPK